MMVVSVAHLKTSLIADGADTSVVRPSDWNANHVIVGLGDAAEYNVGTNATNVIVRSDGDLIYAGSNVTTNNMATSERGNYFYTSNNTFANSTHSHGAVAFSGTNVSGSFTSASGGLSIQLSASAGGAADGYNSAQFTNSTANSTMPLVWAGNSNGSGNVTMGLTGSTVTMSAPSGGGGGVAVSAGASSQSTGTVVFSNSNGVSFGLNAGTVTASHNGLTQQSTQPVAYSAANGSANFSTLSFANSNGVSFSTGTQGVYATVKTDYLTTAAQVSHSHGNPTLNLTNINGTTASASNGLTLSLSVAAQSVQPVAFSASGGASNFSTLSFSNQANGVTFSNSAGQVALSHSLQQLSNTSAITASAMNTSERNNYFYTSNNTFANSTHSHGNPTLALTNISGTTASASNGLTLSLSAAGGGVINQTGPNIAAGTQTATSGTVIFSNANGVTFGLDNQTVTASVNAGGAAPAAYWAAPPWGGVTALITNVTALDKRAFFIPFENIGNLSVQEIMFPMSRSTSGSNAFTLQYGIYSYANSTALSLISSEQDVYSHTATASVSGIRLFEAIFDNTFSIPPGQYAVGLWFSANGGNTASMNYSLMGGTTSNMYSNVIHPGTDNYFTHTTHGAIPMFGRHSVTSGSLPTSMAQSALFGAYTGSNMPIPMAFTIGTHN